MMITPLPPWPTTDPHHGRVRLRAFDPGDLDMVTAMSTDPYVPLIGSLPAQCSPDEAAAFIQRQLGRHAEGAGFSFVIVEVGTGEPVGSVGLWCRQLETGRASVGYSLVPSARGRGLATDAVRAVTKFGWSLPQVHRIELYIEPWNAGSIGVAERVGYHREGLLLSHQEIGGVRRDMLLYAQVRNDCG
jgi:RimJ/RimL family protein N-acetyltransferase